MENGRDCVGEKLAPFNPSGDEAIRVAIEMLQVYQLAPQVGKRNCSSSKIPHLVRSGTKPPPDSQLVRVRVVLVGAAGCRTPRALEQCFALFTLPHGVGAI